MDNVAQSLLDNALRHRVRLEGLSGNLSKAVLAQLNKSFADVTDRLAERLVKIETTGFDAGPQVTARLQYLLDDLESLITKAYGLAGADLVEELKRLATYEAEFTARRMPAEAGVEWQMTMPAPAVLEAIVTVDPIAGSLMAEWTDDLSTATRNRLRQAIRSGVLEGQTTAEIVRAIKGTRAAGYTDGLLEISRRNAQTWVRTSVAMVSARARQITLEENADLVEGERWLSTLDGRTTPICRARDGKIYPVGEGPRPPAHPNCRSTTVFVLKGEKAPNGQRASKNGPVDASLNYGGWLKTQPKEFVQEVLGPTRAKLFLDGRLTLDSFVREDGQQFNLQELQEREKKAFKRAGI